MRRLIIIVEGESEEEFVNKILKKYLNSRGLNNIIQCFKIKHSRGGLSKYNHLKTDILNVIYESNCFITTLIDFYGLPKDFPGYEQSQNISNRNDQVAFLEESILSDIEASKSREFNNLMPYIQLHEFEALVFSSKENIPSLFDAHEFDNQVLNKVIRDFPNPEDINNDPNSAPSIRLKYIIPGYAKILHGALLIEKTGIDTIRNKCPRFNHWLNEVEKRLNL